MARYREPTDFERRFGERLALLRRRAGLTQLELANSAGVSVDALRKWETGRRTPMLDAAARLAKALAVGLDPGTVLAVLCGLRPMPRARQRK